MKGFLIETKNLDPGVLKFILRQQGKFKEQKNGKCVSITYAVNRIIKEAHKEAIEQINVEKTT